jgi:hypothetical protein
MSPARRANDLTENVGDNLGLAHHTIKPPSEPRH